MTLTLRSTVLSLDFVDRFLHCAEKQPNDPAVVVQGRVTTYRTLAERARTFAAAFSRFDAPRILIALPQVADAYACIFGAGLAGGCYTPLNLSAPRAKLRQIARSLNPDVIVASGDITSELLEEAPQAVLVDPRELDPTRQLSGYGRRHELAYILFTSGSTGEPKGVMLPQSALNHYVDWLGSFQADETDRFSQQGNLAFDISVTDIFGALCYGSALYPLLAESDKLMPARMIGRNHITVWNSVPSVISLMMQANQVTTVNLKSVRLFNFCGEPLLREHLAALFAARPDLTVQNTYGPTEATVAVTHIRVDAGNYESVTGASVALGEPIPGMSIHLVGGSHPDEGEIVISGPQLSLGYWNDPIKTAAAFREHVVDGQAMRGYFTGDWAERRAGQLFFKERIDFQIKVRGFRVELDEVTAGIRACGWPVACVFKRGDSLAAVVERSPGRELDEEVLRRELASRVDQHAIPETIVQIDRMPRNDNDKLDRKAVAQWFDDNFAQAAGQDGR